MATTELGSTSDEIKQEMKSSSSAEILEDQKAPKPLRRPRMVTKSLPTTRSKAPQGTPGQSPTALNDSKDSHVIEIKRDSKPSLFIHAQRPECCIYRVHNRLRDTNKRAYTPQMVSIGPFHRGESRTMKKRKQRYLAEFCKRTGKTLIDLRTKIKLKEETIRHCYEEDEVDFDCSEEDEEDFDCSEEETLPSDSFVNIILLDSVFIIEFFLRCYEYYEKDYCQLKYDPIIGKRCLMHAISRDLILLENQVPYFVLQDLYDFAILNTTMKDYPPLFSLACCILLEEFTSPPKIESRKYSCNCFSCLYCFWISRAASFFQKPQKGESEEKHQEEEPQKGESEEKHQEEESLDQYFKRIVGEEHKHFTEMVRRLRTYNPKHFTDMVRRLRTYNQTKPKNNNGADRVLYSATKLHGAGVNFEASSEEWPLGVKFQKGVLTMPRFNLYDNTEQLVRNLMALEQSHYPDEGFICSYICLLDDLVDTESDVDLLVENGIITHQLGDNEGVARMLNDLCKEIAYDKDCYGDIAKELNEHYENCWYRTVANLRHVYFGNLWKGTGTIVAIVLLVLTFVQAYNSF